MSTPQNQNNEGANNQVIDIIDNDPPSYSPNLSASPANESFATSLIQHNKPTKNNNNNNKKQKTETEKKLEKLVSLDFLEKALEPQPKVLHDTLKLLAVDYLSNSDRICDRPATNEKMSAINYMPSSIPKSMFELKCSATVEGNELIHTKWLRVAEEAKEKTEAYNQALKRFCIASGEHELEALVEKRLQDLLANIETYIGGLLIYVKFDHEEWKLQHSERYLQTECFLRFLTTNEGKKLIEHLETNFDNLLTAIVRRNEYCATDFGKFREEFKAMLRTREVIRLEAALASQEPEESIYSDIEYVETTTEYLKVLTTFTTDYTTAILNQKKETAKNANVKKFLKTTDIKTATKRTNDILEQEAPIPPKNLGELVTKISQATHQREVAAEKKRSTTKKIRLNKQANQQLQKRLAEHLKQAQAMQAELASLQQRNNNENNNNNNNQYSPSTPNNKKARDTILKQSKIACCTCQKTLYLNKTSWKASCDKEERALPA